MSAPTGKTLHELNFLNLINIQDRDRVLIGDVSEPLLSKATTVANLRVALGTFAESGYTENEELDIPTWVLEGGKGYWRITILSAVENALAYLICYYNEATDAWTLFPKSVIETRTTVGLSAGPLIMDIFVQRDEDGITPRTYRRFKIQALTSLEKGPLSDEQAAYTIVSLPANFVPAAPTLVDDESYPYTAVRKRYGQYSHSIVLRANAATGEADYIERYELQRRPYVEGQSAKAGWVTLPMHTLGRNPQKPAPSRLIYTDDSAEAAPGDVLEYRIQAVAITGEDHETPSIWSSEDPEQDGPVTYTVENDDTAPDPPVLTVNEVQLGFKIIFDDPTQNDGDPCDDIYYWELYYSTDAGETWECVLDPKHEGKDRRITNQESTFHVPDADLGEDFVFKAVAVDWSGNMSEMSEVTTPTNPNPITMDSVDTEFTQKLAIIDSTATTVSTHTTEISQNAEAIALKASQTDFDTLDGRVESAETSIVVNADAITLKASQTALNTTNGNVSTLSGEVDVLAEEVEIAVKVDGTTVSSFVAGVSGLRLKGESIELDGDTSCLGDFTVQGLLNPAGGIKTANSGSRLEMGGFGGAAALKAYDGVNNIRFAMSVALDGFYLYDGSGNYFAWMQSSGAYYTWDGNARIELKVGATAGSIEINQIKVIGEQQAHIVDADGTLADITTKFNTLLSELEAFGPLASS